MFRRTMLSTAVAVALGSSFASTAAYANEDSVEKLEKIQVTGSRISRVDVEGATPVTVITREDIDRSGQLTVADVLRNSTYNSFGSFSERSGSSWQSQAFVDMRGLGAERTLVLLNGKRMPMSGAHGGGAVNINAIPAAAVESIEILADGASAVYGSDAIGGVVNIILRKDFEGVNVEVGGANTKIEGPDERKFSITGGAAGERGNILFSYEHDERGIIKFKDYEPASEGLSLYGRNIQGKVAGATTAYKALNGASCGAENFVSAAGLCLYNYAEVAALTTETQRDQFVISSNYSLSDEIEWSNEAVIGLNRSFGRFAPAADKFTVEGGTTGGDALLGHNGYDTGVGNDAEMYYRFDQVGPRDDEVKDFSAILTSSLNGSIDSLFGTYVDWNLATRYSKSLSDKTGIGYVLRSVAEEAVNSGVGFDHLTGEFSADVIKEMTYDISRDIEVSYADVSGGLQFELGELFENPVSWYVGAEASRQDYKDEYDAQSAAGNVLGSSGNNSGGDRTQKALFIESLIPVHDMVELNLAARYDRYSDFGSAVSPKASVRVQPMDNLVVRGSWAKGFRAPGLTSLYKSDSKSADSAVDYIKCQVDSVSPCDGNKVYDRQYDTIHAANPDLEAEKSKSFNFGVVYSPIDELNLGVDFYSIEVKDMVYTPSLQELIDAELAGKSTDGLLVRDPNTQDITSVTIKWSSSDLI